MSVSNKFEKAAAGNGLPLGDVFDGLPCNADGLVPAIARQHETFLLLVDQTGAACRAGRRYRSCNEVPGVRVEAMTETVVETKPLYGK